jgi:hypothetical protein
VRNPARSGACQVYRLIDLSAFVRSLVSFLLLYFMLLHACFSKRRSLAIQVAAAKQPASQPAICAVSITPALDEALQDTGAPLMADRRFAGTEELLLAGPATPETFWGSRSRKVPPIGGPKCRSAGNLHMALRWCRMPVQCPKGGCRPIAIVIISLGIRSKTLAWHGRLLIL